MDVSRLNHCVREACEAAGGVTSGIRQIVESAGECAREGDERQSKSPNARSERSVRTFSGIRGARRCEARGVGFRAAGGGTGRLQSRPSASHTLGIVGVRHVQCAAAAGRRPRASTSAASTYKRSFCQPASPAVGPRNGVGAARSFDEPLAVHLAAGGVADKKGWAPKRAHPRPLRRAAILERHRQAREPVPPEDIVEEGIGVVAR